MHAQLAERARAAAAERAEKQRLRSEERQRESDALLAETHTDTDPAMYADTDPDALDVVETMDVQTQLYAANAAEIARLNTFVKIARSNTWRNLEFVKLEEDDQGALRGRGDA